jgi:hypothetical protein
MAREFVYQYNGKVNLRDDPEIAADTVRIPAPDTVVRRHDTNYRVTSVSRHERPTAPSAIHH